LLPKFAECSRQFPITPEIHRKTPNQIDASTQLSTVQWFFPKRNIILCKIEASDAIIVSMATRSRRQSGVVQLRNAIRRSNMSGAQLSHLSGVSEPALSRIIRGMTSPRIDSADAILKALGLEFRIVPSRSSRRKKS